MSPAIRSKGKFRQRVLNNFWLKAVSLLIAILLWLAVSNRV